MPNDIEHERYRFSRMNERGLWTRLGRITDVTKLRNFIVMCEQYGYRSLRDAAEDKLNERLGVRERRPVADDVQISRDALMRAALQQRDERMRRDAEALARMNRERARDRSSRAVVNNGTCARCGAGIDLGATPYRFGNPYCGECVVLVDQESMGTRARAKPKEKMRVIRIGKKNKGGRDE